ncbi:glycosyltransferase family 9 protein [Pseudorhodoferax soli]|uniref:Lipopolysaccharide heptosyltransferase II n=1 Tax=Pseudorhodoferax soli TaxID=545864 RepID=A0A368X9U5_9BURK|nr:glycosyltransferase family 9 protein [Pseudorhodoferax soli]RCW64733.1 lipopolysaccharide heptosyltransferase II [Pseudorhodoferax soli]
MTPPAAGLDPRWAAVRRLLVVRLDNLGDLLMTTPALAAIRHSLPGVHMTLLGSPATMAALAHLPMLDEAIGYDAPWVKGQAGDDAGPDHRLLLRLGCGRYDAAIIFTVCTQSALPAAMLCRLAQIPLRLAHSRENPYALLSDWVLDGERVEQGMRHEVQRQLDLVHSVGMQAADRRLVFHYAAAHMRAARRRLVAAGCDAAQPYVVVHVGATAPSRRYPPERFAAAADAIAAASGHCIVFTGSSAEAPLVERARASMRRPSVSLAGQLGLGEFGALLASARVLVSNNTGPVHMAAALGTPVAVLYAQTNPQHTPWLTAARVLYHDVGCRNCLRSVCPEGHNDCLQRVEPAAVAAAALDLMGLGHAAVQPAQAMASAPARAPLSLVGAQA